MDIIYYLSSCETCKRILNDLAPPESIVLQDIKKNHISAIELDTIHNIIGGSYEDLLNKRSRIYQFERLKDMSLTEKELRAWILKEYSMLKRPLAVIGDQVFAGNSKNTVEALKQKINNLRH